MLTIADITRRRLKHEGILLVKGNLDSLMPIVPYVLLDIQYQAYTEYIAPLKDSLTHEMAKDLGRWEKAYKSINDRFFRPFSEDEYGDVTDVMDELTSVVHNDLMVLRVTIMNCVPKIDLQDQNVLATLAECNILAQWARNVYERIYTDGPYRLTEIREMKTIAESAVDLSDRYYYWRGGREYVGVLNRDDVANAVMALIKRLNKYIRNKK